MPATSNSQATSDDDAEALERLLAAADALADIEDRIDAHGGDAVERVAAAHREAVATIERHAEDATGTGDFQAYVTFRDEFDGLVEDLPDALPRRDAFEAAAEYVDRRTIREKDLRRAREALAPAAELAKLADEREGALETYREARHAAIARRREIDERIEELERLLELGEADLEADVSALQDPLEDYNAAVREAFDSFADEASARELFAFVETASSYSLVEFREPPDRLREYLEADPVGTEPVPTLLQYADYSTSKLGHYVEDPRRFRGAVATNQTYLERLDAEPLTLSWPPAPADRVRYRVDTLVSVASRIADENAIVPLREVGDLARDADRFERLRRTAVARQELSADQRERLQSGAVERELADLRAEREELAAALEEHRER